MTTPKFNFEHTFAEQLDGLYVDHAPPGFAAPVLLELNRPLLGELGLTGISDGRAAKNFSGSILPAGARPIAQAYAGHQFGHLSPQLGDGRAVLLGELTDRAGRRVDLHLKGSGRTPFSRGGDGLAALGPILRELLLSEAMAHLGVSTSRVLAVVKTGAEVQRDKVLPGAVLARIAASHLRVGSLEYVAVQRDQALLQKLVRYALARHFPEEEDSEHPAEALLHEVARSQAKLIASWMQIGFIHGVMNTDNVTLSGETLDYGPCAFLDVYDPGTVFSSIDRNGRYAFGQQPEIGSWNMMRMAQAVVWGFYEQENTVRDVAERCSATYRDTFNASYLQGMRKKIGLDNEREGDFELLEDLMQWMHDHQQDFTLTFRRLADAIRGHAAPSKKDRGETATWPLSDATQATLTAWLVRWKKRLAANDLAADDLSGMAQRMDNLNPLYIPRNHLVEEVLAQAEANNMAPFREFMDVLARPFEERPGLERFAEPAPDSFTNHRTFCGT